MARITQKKAELLQRLVTPISKQISDINFGGCGIFTVYLCEILCGKGYKCKPVCLDETAGRTKREHLHNLKWIGQKDENFIFGYNHICLQVGNFYIDSLRLERVRKEGVFGSQYRKLGHISPEKLHYLITLDWNWNSCYNRRQNKRLWRLLSITLAEF